MPPAEAAIQLGGLLAEPLKAQIALLGIAETSSDEQSLREALQKQAGVLDGCAISLDIIVQSGEPVRQIVDQTTKNRYELLVIGTRCTGEIGPPCRSDTH